MAEDSRARRLKPAQKQSEQQRVTKTFDKQDKRTPMSCHKDDGN